MGVALATVLSTWAQSAAAYAGSMLGITYASAGSFLAVATVIQVGGFIAMGALLQALFPTPTASSTAGQKLQTKKTNTAPVPVVYGRNRLGGNIIYQKTNNYNGGTTNNDYWAIIAIAEAELFQFNKVFENEDELEKIATNKFTSKYVQARTYTTSGDGINLNDVEYITDDLGTVATGSSIFGQSIITTSRAVNESFLTDGNITSFFNYWEAGATINQWIKVDLLQSEQLNFIKIYIENDTALALYDFKLQYSDDDATWFDAGASVQNSGDSGRSWYSLPKTEADPHRYWRVYFTTISRYNRGDDGSTDNGRVFEIDVDAESTSTVAIPPNTAFISIHQKYASAGLAHVQLGNISAEVDGKLIKYVGTETVGYSYQPIDIIYDIMVNDMGVADSEIDIDNFLATKIKTTANSAFCNICFTERVNFENSLQSVLATMRGFLVYSGGKWKVYTDTTGTSVRTITQDDILNNSLTVAMAGFEDIFNKSTMQYINPDDEWQMAEATYEDEALVTIDGQEIKTIADARGVTDTALATKLATLSLNQTRYSENSSGKRIKQTPLNIEFSTTIKHADLEINDIITLSHDLLNFDRKFKIIDIKTNQAGTISLSCREYCDTHYKDANNNTIWS